MVRYASEVNENGSLHNVSLLVDDMGYFSMLPSQIFKA